MWVGSERSTLCTSANEEPDTLVNNAPLTEIPQLKDRCPIQTDTKHSAIKGNAERRSLEASNEVRTEFRDVEMPACNARHERQD